MIETTQLIESNKIRFFSKKKHDLLYKFNSWRYKFMEWVVKNVEKV